MKENTIRPDNYEKFKPSELVRSFASDVDVAINKKKPMDMNSYLPSIDCLPCLGGMACMNMNVDPYDSDKIGDYISSMGDAIRNGTINDFLIYLKELYPVIDTNKIYNLLIKIVLKSFRGEVATISRFEELKVQIHKYADAVEAAGY